MYYHARLDKGKLVDNFESTCNCNVVEDISSEMNISTSSKPSVQPANGCPSITATNKYKEDIYGWKEIFDDQEPIENKVLRDLKNKISKQKTAYSRTHSKHPSVSTTAGEVLIDDVSLSKGDNTVSESNGIFASVLNESYFNSSNSDSTICESYSLQQEMNNYSARYLKTLNNQLFNILDATVTSTYEGISTAWNIYTLPDSLKISLGDHLRKALVLSLDNLSKSDMNQLFDDLEYDGISRELGEILCDKDESFTQHEKHEMVKNLMNYLIGKLDSYQAQFSHINISEINSKNHYSSCIEKNIFVSIVRGCLSYVDDVMGMVNKYKLYNETLLNNHLKTTYVLSLRLDEDDYRNSKKASGNIKKDKNVQPKYSVSLSYIFFTYFMQKKLN